MDDGDLSRRVDWWLGLMMGRVFDLVEVDDGFVLVMH
jgi:hypothetical protein